MADPSANRPSRLTVLLFTDIVGSTDLKSRLGLAEFTSLLERHNYLFESLAADIPGAEVLKHTGDGYLATVPTASDAVRLALRFQRALSDEPWQGGATIESRIGIHLGEVSSVTMAGRPDVVGLAADLAARVMSLAGPRQVLLTKSAFDNARQYAATFTNLSDQPRWLAHGDYLFKGSEEPIEIFEVGLPGLSPLAPPASSEKNRRVVPHLLEETLGWRPAAGLDIPDRTGWTLVKKIGDGGFGEVWLGAHAQTHENRVFKFCFDAERLRSFKRELTLFRLLREALGDRNDIARLHEVKLDKAPFFLESEYTAGGNLLDWAKARGGIASLPLPMRLEIVAQIADAVAAAHSVGILHKDIKPSNILIEERSDGTIQPRLADFGIGLLADRKTLDRLGITDTGFDTAVVTVGTDASRSGTRLYAPPELLAGKPFTVQGDIYALGVLLYQMCVADLTRPLAPGWERDITDDLLRADIAACADGDPSRRISSANEVATRLRTLEDRRERKRLTETAARSAARRLQVVRNSIAAVSVLTVLLLIVAGGSFYYIRKIRAAQAAEAAQRARAESSEHLARTEADNAQREAAHSKAQYLFSQRLFRPAYEQAVRATGSGARWEDRLLLSTIVSSTRRDWSLIGQVPVAVVDTVHGCFAGGTHPVLVVPAGNRIQSFSIPDTQVLATTDLEVPPDYVSAVSDDLVAVVTGPVLELRDARTLSLRSQWQAPAGIRAIAVRPGAPIIVALDSSNHVVVLDVANLHERARHSFPFPDRAPVGASASPSIDLSPDGNQILAHSGVWTNPVYCWDWTANTSVQFDDFNCHQVCFVDDQTIAGFSTGGAGSDNPGIHFFEFPSGKAMIATNSPHSLAKAETHIVGWTAPQPASIDQTTPPEKSDSYRVSMVGAEGIDIVEAKGQLSSDRFDSLWPLGNDTPTLAAYEPATGLLAVTFGTRTLLFESSPHHISYSTQAGVAHWSQAISSTAMWGADYKNAATPPNLTRIPFDGGDPRVLPLEWPAPGADHRATPWGIWVTPDEHFATVLWQEDINGSVASPYFRKSILIYDLSSASPKSPAPLVRNIPLDNFNEQDGRKNRGVFLTPDRSTVVFAPSSGNIARFRVADSSPLPDLKIAESFVFSPDASLVAAGSFNSSMPIKVYDVASGKLLFTTPRSDLTERICFSADGQRIAMNWNHEDLECYDIASGSRTLAIKSKLLPIALPAAGDQFLALAPDGPVTGSLVLASLTTGDTAIVINPTAHVINNAFFSREGDAIAFVRTRDSAVLLRSLNPNSARDAICRVAPSHFASALPSLTEAAPRIVDPVAPPAQAAPTRASPSIVNASDIPVITRWLGKTVTVTGHVHSASWSVTGAVFTAEFDGLDATLLDIAIFASNRAPFDQAFNGNVATALNGATVRVTGKVVRYGGRNTAWKDRLQIVLDRPDQLQILTPAPASVSAPVADASLAQIINVTDTAALTAAVGKRVTVAGKISVAHWAANNKVFTIDFENPDPKGFYCVLFPTVRDKFDRALGANFSNTLAGKSVQITGPLVTYQGRLEIVLTDPSQLTILDPKK